jgi:hypothetical protein
MLKPTLLERRSRPMSSSPPPAVAVRFVLKADDQWPSDWSDPDRAELESVSRGTEKVPARIPATGQEISGLKQELSFCCEWWPPE